VTLAVLIGKWPKKFYGRGINISVESSIKKKKNKKVTGRYKASNIKDTLQWQSDRHGITFETLQFRVCWIKSSDIII
jgi:hypothetical protein